MPILVKTENNKILNEVIKYSIIGIVQYYEEKI